MPVSEAILHSSLLTDLRQLGRVLTLRRPEPGSFSPNIAKLPWLVLFYCLISIILSIALNGWEDGAIIEGATFVGTASVPFAAVALFAGLLKWMDRRQDGEAVWLVFTLLLLIVPLAGFIGAKLVSVITNLAFFYHSRYTYPDSDTSLPGDWHLGDISLAPWFAYFISALPHIWLALAGARYIAHIGRGWQRILCVPFTLSALFAVFTSANPLALWQVDTDAPLTYTKETGGLAIDEEVFYGQSRLLDEHLARIETGKPGVPEIFFLGFAGDEEGVFMRETITVEQLFRDRYATAGHTMILVNNPATARRLPFANHESLSRALRRIGEQMNGEEDLLFLFLTSHGSADHRFSIKFSPFGFSDITPEMLRTALDEAGIKRRVVVVSACYSGGFIPRLADPDTLVITAADADRNSFGCNDTNDLTDFGRAYFDEALRETRSFTEAFERAKATIAAREAADGITSSNPQIAGGESLHAQLEWFAREPGRGN
ncbi:MAG: C13 family peptidase [Betaproteobacteria bacterium]|nr:C13 family peptidase [Betaproteobacteria bacterium]